jgi:hypothetical protein
MIILIKALWLSGMAFALHESFQFLISKFPNRKLKKPFSCVSCLSFWLGLLGSVILFDPLLIFLPFVFTKVINRYLWS